MKKQLAVMAFLFAISVPAIAQKKSAVRKDTPSVVLLRPNEKVAVDSTLLRDEKPATKRRRRFQVKVVPAPPPGRNWQEIRYSDSLGRKP